MPKIANVQSKKSSSSTSKKSAAAIDSNEVAKLAYQFYVERGGQHGSDLEDWLRAEKIVKSRKYNS